MELAKQVRQYYLDHFAELPQEKQFHFVSRLASWSNDTTCHGLLQKQKEYLMPKDKTASSVLRDIIENPPSAKINAAHERAPYFTKYPELRGRMLALFRVRHMLALYNTDIRQELVDLVPYQELHAMSEHLMADEAAVQTLSTYAVNYLYLVEDILFNYGDVTLDPNALLKFGKSYDTDNPNQLLLLTYLFTHCIIGESNFYVSPIKPERRATYNKMLAHLDGIISRHFDNINLDNKLEFLVCCRILSHDTKLFERIYDECQQSVSSEGTFLVDTLNSAQQSQKTSFIDSEHRNVLFVMSSLAYGHSR